MVGIDDPVEPLCVTCGICCGGAMFDYGKVTPEEEPRLRALGFAIAKENETAVFALPCGNLCGTACQVYADRPATCRAFTCPTLRQIESGEIDRTEADRRVAATKYAVDEVRHHLLPGETFRQLRQRFGGYGQPPADLQVAMVAYDMLMDRYFRKPHQRVLVGH